MYNRLISDHQLNFNSHQGISFFPVICGLTACFSLTSQLAVVNMAHISCYHDTVHCVEKQTILSSSFVCSVITKTEGVGGRESGMPCPVLSHEDHSFRHRAYSAITTKLVISEKVNTILPYASPIW